MGCQHLKHMCVCFAVTPLPSWSATALSKPTFVLSPVLTALHQSTALPACALSCYLLEDVMNVFPPHLVCYCLVKASFWVAASANCAASVNCAACILLCYLLEM
jgi:hypothetical protein